MDKSKWAEGPWMHEPDFAEYNDPVTGYYYQIKRNSAGALCGYVGVGPSHPCFGKHYGDVEAHAHGGLTYSDAKRDNPAIWLLGFDCAHLGDLCPELFTLRQPGGLLYRGSFARGVGAFGEHEEYRDWDFVKAQIASLAAQLAEISRAHHSD